MKLKKLLFAIATSAPFTPNINKLGERIGMLRAMLIRAIKQLERAGLVNELQTNQGNLRFNEARKNYT